MSGKSILFSILALVLYAALIVGIVFMFKVQFIVGIIGIILLFIPFKIQRKAIDEADGKFDQIFAKYIIAALLLIAIVFIILYFTMWS